MMAVLPPVTLLSLCLGVQQQQLRQLTLPLVLSSMCQ